MSAQHKRKRSCGCAGGVWTKEQQAFLHVPEEKRDLIWWEQFPTTTCYSCRSRAPIAELSKDQLIQLCDTFVFGALLPEERPLSLGNGLPAGTKRNYSVRWRTQVPSAEERLALSRLVQGSPEWLFRRGQGVGGSETGEITNTSHYRSRRDVWFKHVGDMAEAAQSPDECFNFDHGHAGEPYAAKWYGMVMQMVTLLELGIIPHPVYPFAQASPDRVSIAHPLVVHNEWSRYDSIRGNQEIKNPVFAVHQLSMFFDVPFMVCIDYCTQQQGQSDTSRTSWNDFISCWRAGIRRNVVPLPRMDKGEVLFKALGPWVAEPATEAFESIDVDTGRVERATNEGQILDIICAYMDNDHHRPVAYLAGKMLITRQYHSKTFCRAMYQMVGDHVDSVRRRREPLPPSNLHSGYPTSQRARMLNRSPAMELDATQDDEPPSNFDGARLQLVPMKRVEWVIHGSSKRPSYDTLFPRPKYTSRENQAELDRGMLDDVRRQSCTVPGQVDKHWRDPQWPASWPWATKQFYITVFVTSYPKAVPLGHHKGLTVRQLTKRYEGHMK